MKQHKDGSYEQMTNGIGAQSIPSEYWNPPLINNYEMTRKSFYGDEGFDWSGMEKRK